MFSLPVLREDVDAAGARWRRIGECNRCGECCKSGDPFGGELGAGQVAGACPLYAEALGVGSCTDHTNPYYLSACVAWPSLPAHVAPYPSCSFTFEQVI